MQIYLPIAELSVNIMALLALGGAAGLLSGMFGIGGGFFMTPILIFMGVPPAVSVASAANQIIASSFSGFLNHWRRHHVDFQMGFLLLVGGLVGSTFGIWLFEWLQKKGQIDLFISVSYVAFLTTIGGLMAKESWTYLWHKRQGTTPPAPETSTSDRLRAYTQRWPFHMEFERSNMHCSALLPLLVGTASGLLVSMMGIGGGFVMIPAMIYILGMPSSVVVGTSLFQIIFITAHVTFLHALNTHTVDAVLAVTLILGSVVGAQLGSNMAAKVQAVKLRALLAALVLLVALRLAYGLFITPDELYSIIPEVG